VRSRRKARRFPHPQYGRRRTCRRIFDAKRVDRTESVSQSDAEGTMRRMAREEGIFAACRRAAPCAVALRISREVQNATIVFVVCDRGDRYLSTGVFPG
jgi:cysteine synthase B